MTEQFDSTFNEMVKFSEALGSALADIFEQIAPALVEFYEGCQSAYREVGSPYGATDEGMQRWIREVGEARGLQREAELMLEHHKTLAYLRERVKESDEPKSNEIDPAIIERANKLLPLLLEIETDHTVVKGERAKYSFGLEGIVEGRLDERRAKAIMRDAEIWYWQLYRSTSNHIYGLYKNEKLTPAPWIEIEGKWEGW